MENTLISLWDDEIGPSDDNFCRVFELPMTYPSDFCFTGGVPVEMNMVDWFNPWPSGGVRPWEQAEPLIRNAVAKKKYIKPMHQYVVITNFGKAIMIWESK